MQLISLLEKMNMDHLVVQLDSICEQAAKKDLGYKDFLTQALDTERGGAAPKRRRDPVEDGPPSLGKDPGAIRF